MGRPLLALLLLLSTGALQAQAPSGCRGSPCLQPAAAQAAALFDSIEHLYPQLFFPAARTQSQALDGSEALFREYGGASGWGLATWQGGLWYRSAGQWTRFGALEDGDRQLCSSQCLLPAAADGAFTGSVVLGAPTDSGVVLSLYASEQSGRLRVEYGRRGQPLSESSATVGLSAGQPVTLTLAGLAADTAYDYRVQFQPQGMAQEVAGAVHRFHTARPAGSSFTFTVQADSHMDENSVVRMYQRTLANVLAAQPDFHVDLGDTFMTEKHQAPLSLTSAPASSAAAVEQRYVYERGNFAAITADVPLFLANGNHEGELGWLKTTAGNDIANWAAQARQRYFVAPATGGFYSGENGGSARGAWYAWHWGAALFVVLDPYWYSARTKGADGWSMTLGPEQYRWLESTLASSTAAFKFVFLHSLVGGLDGQMRGGAEAARFFEWGGYDSDNTTRSFASKRPGWNAPIHELFVRHGVSAVFHGHDHLYVKQELDGIVYQEVPQPSALNTNNAANLARDYHYDSGVALSSAGHLRITVTPNDVTAAYVRTWLPEQENAQRRNGQIDHQWVITRKP